MDTLKMKVKKIRRKFRRISCADQEIENGEA